MNQTSKFSGSRILLVGATGVLGRGYASAIAELNVQLIIADTAQSDVLLYAKELNVLGCEIDISSEDSVIKCIKYVENQLGGLDAVINNAAATSESLMNSGDLFEDFVNVLSTVDVLILLDVYAAGEAPIRGADGRALSSAIRARAQVNPVFVENSDDLAEILVGIIQPNDVLLTMGAGNVGHIATQLPQQLVELLEK